MKDYDNSLVLLLQADEAVSFWAVDLLITSTEHVRYSNLDIDVYVGGNKFRSREFSVDPVNYTTDLSVDKMQLLFADQEQEMAAILGNYTIVNRECIIYLGAMDGFTPVVEEFFRGPVSAWDMDKEVEIIVSTEMVFWNKRALRLPGDICPWTLGDVECSYTGSETACNGTYDRCLVLGMEDSFGGARFLPSLEEKQIQWGKKSV
ncbi:MAG: hypothetical protein MI862_02090 [Desulfobacterales bacterium]|nr:hypothetical protein [Desulfobacterales bacterium]